jgi:arginyl-tRNA synthetase
MLASITKKLEEILLQGIEARYQILYDSLNFTIPPRIELGELALPIAFDLARKMRQPPRQIAQELVAMAEQVPGLWKVEVAGAGYLNFYLDRGKLALGLKSTIEEGLHGRATQADAAGKIIVEHTNINPNKAAHIGHLRNAALGDSFVRCLRFLGSQVEVQNYLDNTGVQVADVVVGFERMEGKSLEAVQSIGGKFDYYCWDVYARVAEFYRQSEENRRWRGQTLQAIEAGDNPTAKLAQYVAMRIVHAHLATMARIHVRYDLLPRESEILQLKFWERAFDLLKERGAIYLVDEGKNQGCWVMSTGDPSDAGSSDSAGDRPEEEEKIIVRSDGTVTYVGKDIAYQLWKFGLLGLDFRYRPFEFEGEQALWVTTAEEVSVPAQPEFGAARRVYNVIDSRQAYLQAIVLQGLRALGFQEEADNSIHFSYEMVALTPSCCAELGFQLSEQERTRPYVEVSGRKGLGVKADDLLDILEEKALAEVEARHDLPAQEAEDIAHTIAVGALRYFLLRFARNTVIAFDFREALSFEGETGPYVQYAVVRADNIFRKFEATGADPWDPKTITPDDLTQFLGSHDDIWDLLYHATRLPEIVRLVSESLELSQLCKYAFQLAQKFNLFYHRYHILSEADPTKKRYLLLVVDLVRKQLEKALDLLGCEVPPKM